MTRSSAALVATHLSDRRRSVLAWGLPLGLMSAFIVAIFPSVEDVDLEGGRRATRRG